MRSEPSPTPSSGRATRRSRRRAGSSGRFMATGGEPALGLVGQEVLEGGGGLERDLLGQEVAAGQRAAGYRVGVLAPDLGDVAVVAADEAVLAPQGEQRDSDALPPRGGGVIVCQVGAGRGAVVLARGMDRGG